MDRETRGVCFFVFLILAGCAHAPATQLYKDGASYQDFSSDRYACIQEAQQPVSRAHISQYGGSARSEVRPSRGVYLSCMAARGYHPVESGGFVPATEVRMTR
jgi:hypothetical protein